MPNSLTDRALPGTGADAGSLSSQGPEVDKPALETPPSPDMPPMPGGKQHSSKDLSQSIDNTLMIDSKLRRLLAQDGPIKRKDIIDMATEIVAERGMSAQAMAGYLADLPEDPQDIREWVQRHANAADQSLNQLLIALHGSEMPKTAMGGPAGGQMSGGPASQATPPTVPSTPTLQ